MGKKSTEENLDNTPDDSRFCNRIWHEKKSFQYDFLQMRKIIPVPNVEQIIVKILPLIEPAENFLVRKLAKSRGIGVYRIMRRAEKERQGTVGSRENLSEANVSRIR